MGAHDQHRAAWSEIDKVIDIDQSPIGRTPRSNPATYTKLFDVIRDFFALLPEARMHGYTPGRFSFNVKGGRCEACEGDGVKRVEMHFLPDVYVPCEVCHGKRFNEATLQVKYNGLSIADVLDLTVDEALSLFKNHPQIRRALETLADVGLGYIALGQTSPTLSGGEAQRVKLSRELSKRSTGPHALHPRRAHHRPALRGHPEAAARARPAGGGRQHGGGDRAQPRRDQDRRPRRSTSAPTAATRGGRVVAEGTPEQVAAVRDSHTGRFLADLLPRTSGRPRARRGERAPCFLLTRFPA